MCILEYITSDTKRRGGGGGGGVTLEEHYEGISMVTRYIFKPDCGCWNLYF